VSPRARSALILATAAVAGAGTMIVELAAVRLLAPWFGSSLVVWTNVIAVVLLALALGYLVGGRLSRGGAPLARMAWTLGLGAAFTALLPLLAPRVSELLVPTGLKLDEAADLVRWGSLAASLLLFLPPAACLGTVAPLAVEAVQRHAGGRAGQAGGLVLCTSTLGSLVGVFGTSLVFLPSLGLSGTFLLAAGVLALATGIAATLARADGHRHAPGAGGPALLGIAVGLLGPGSGGPALGPDVRLLGSAESPYQSVRIVEDTTDPDAPLRLLQVNEGFDSYQSVWQPEPGLLGMGYYYNDFALPAWWSGASGPWRVVVLGLGAGTAFRVLRGASPPGVELELVGVELDPEVVRLAGEHMDLDADASDARILSGLDARVALRALGGEHDLVILDCYANQVEIPPHLCTLEFFREVRAALGEGGWLAANLGGFGFDDPVVEAVAESCAAAFDADVLLLRVPRSRNFTLLARRDAPLPLDAEGRPWPVAAEVDRLVQPRLLPGALRRVAPPSDGAPLTDGHCPVETLQMRSLAEARERLLAEARG